MDRIDRGACARHELALAVLTNGFCQRQLMATYVAFDRDLIAAIVLGEVVTHNVSALTGGASSARALTAAADRLARDGRTALRPANAFAIAQATGIPRQTVRRKIAALVARGLIDRGAHGRLYVSRGTLAALSDFNFERLADVIATAGLIGEVLQIDVPELL